MKLFKTILDAVQQSQLFIGFSTTGLKSLAQLLERAVLQRLKDFQLPLGKTLDPKLLPVGLSAPCTAGAAQ